MKNVLVNGCSFTGTYGAWPFHLTDFNVTNIACMGAGNTYIHDSTVIELAQRHKLYDHVVIMWSGLTRVDLKVEDVSLFSNTQYTSTGMIVKQDTPERVLYSGDGLDYIEKNWVFGSGQNRCDQLDKLKLFDSIYKYQGINQLIESSLIKMISLQNILKQQQIPYLFTYYQDYNTDLKKFTHLYKMLDQENIYNEQNIFTLAKNNNCYASDGIHPGLEIYKKWAEIVTNIIN